MTPKRSPGVFTGASSAHSTGSGNSAGQYFAFAMPSFTCTFCQSHRVLFHESVTTPYPARSARFVSFSSAKRSRNVR